MAITRPIGSIFQDGKDLIKVVKCGIHTCRSCYYNRLGFNCVLDSLRFQIAGGCRESSFISSREDGEDVIFKKIN